MSTAGKTIDIPDLINNNKIGSFQIGMLILCGLCVIMDGCLLYTSPSPRDQRGSRMPSSA